MEDIHWDQIDKRTFFVKGIGAFSGVTTMLFPLTVIKTRQMASHGVSGGFQGTKLTAAAIWRQEGIPGFYRGFGTVVFGTIPARTMYLTSLEVVKSTVAKAGRQLELSDTTVAGVSNFLGGAAASMSTQLVAVPIDVVSQRQMMLGADLPGSGKSGAVAGSQAAAGQGQGGQAAQTGSQAAQQGMPGSGSSGAHSGSSSNSTGSSASRQFSSTACRHSSRAAHPVGGLGASTAANRVHLLAGSRAMLHASSAAASQAAAGSVAAAQAAAAAASAHQRLGGLTVARMIIKEEGIRGLYRGFGMSLATFVPNSAIWWSCYGVYKQVLSSSYQKLLGSSSSSSVSTNEVVALQILSSMLAGATSGMITNPLDLIKTRIQVARKQEGQAASFRTCLEEILREDGPSGLMRGVLPRMASAALWGTCMVTVYEFLKRVSRKPTDGQQN